MATLLINNMKTIFSIVFLFIAQALYAQKQTTFTVNFDFNKYDITPMAAARLDSFVATILSKPTSFTIDIYGHCDSVGSNEYNDVLSLNRTESVKNYLAAKGLPSFSVFKEKGLGKRQPLNKNATDYERFLNRRVVVDVTIPGRSVVTIPVKKTGEKIHEKSVEKTVTTFVTDTSTTVGSKFTLKNLIFIGGRHFLMPESFPVLWELLSVMNENPKLEISIEGHVCCIPGNNDGIDLDLNTANLSEMRAKYVYDHLVRYGISPKRLSYKGFGHQYPLAAYPEKNVEEMNNNRRVEIKVVSK